MGIVINQSINNTITTYLGFVLGAFNVLFLYTYFLSDEYHGLLAFIISTATIMLPFISLGTQMHLIFVSEYEGDFIYDIRGFTVAPNDTFEIEDHDMRVTDRNGLMEAVSHIND